MFFIALSFSLDIALSLSPFLYCSFSCPSLFFWPSVFLFIAHFLHCGICLTSLTMKQMLIWVILLAEISLWSNPNAQKETARIRREGGCAGESDLVTKAKAGYSTGELLHLSPLYMCFSYPTFYMMCSQSIVSITLHFTLELDLDKSHYECQCFPPPPPLRPTYAHASVCDYINDMLSGDPNPFPLGAYIKM